MTPLKTAIVYYNHFAPLDVYGPMQAMNVSFGLEDTGKPDPSKPLFRQFSVAAQIGFCQTGLANDNPQVFCSYNFETLPPVDAVLIPGGMGSRKLVDDDLFIDQLGALVRKTPIVLSVCTGAALLARTGFLDGKTATSNKTPDSWEFVKKQGANVVWDYKPRWTGSLDRDSLSGYMTSGGVAAGIDMMLALIYELYGEKIVQNTQDKMEYTWNKDPAVDPFTKLMLRSKQDA